MQVSEVVIHRYLFALCLGALGLAACQPSAQIEQAIFVDASAASGLDFVHINGMSGRHLFPEIQGPGVALFDFDNDGDLDVYLVQGGYLEDSGTNGRDYSNPVDRLYRNDLVQSANGQQRIQFSDVTGAAGLHADGYGMGVTTGDYDNDGDIDLYLSNFGNNQLWRNNGDGTFSDVSEESGTADPRWSHSAVFVDIDRDGWLDLMVVKYVDFRLGNR
ncbi:MAG: VCBS repeat-containing protein [Gammaproteobacteria bacterium]|nr:VCBS repeat-containing protein [Gammaproteobacteria bacterium]